MEQRELLKIAILNDLLGIELNNFPIDRILDGSLQSRLRNLKKSVTFTTNKFDEMFKGEDNCSQFGDVCDKINEGLNEFLKESLVIEK